LIFRKIQTYAFLADAVPAHNGLHDLTSYFTERHSFHAIPAK
jgi:hypothetical protein